MKSNHKFTVTVKTVYQHMTEEMFKEFCAQLEIELPKHVVEGLIRDREVVTFSQIDGNLLGNDLIGHTSIKTEIEL